MTVLKFAQFYFNKEPTMSFNALRELQNNNKYKAGDLLVIFGELFDRGYTNGLINAAKKKGMKIVTGTVGRRDENGLLRPLNSEELAEKSEDVINIPLEAGFDIEPGPKGSSAVDMLAGTKMSQWQEARLDWDEVNAAQNKAVENFKKRVNDFLQELESKYINEDTNVLFAHTMAGGFPRAKIIMTVANRVFKGSGDRFLSSEVFWNSELGQLCQKNFQEVTGETYKHLLDLSKPLRNKIKENGQHVSYVAYGYHGTEILINDQLTWQSYAPYLQGWAKVRLEEISNQAHDEGISSCVFNAPEILTNSSSIFLGVEVPLYKLMPAIAMFKSSEAYDKICKKCNSLLKDDVDIEVVLNKLNDYFNNNTTKRLLDFSSAWPQHNDSNQMKLMRELSTEIIDMHKDKKQLMTAELSQIVYNSCGLAMLDESWEPQHGTTWIGHDLVAKLS